MTKMSEEQIKDHIAEKKKLMRKCELACGEVVKTWSKEARLLIEAREEFEDVQFDLIDLMRLVRDVAVVHQPRDPELN